jgi:hypothetical protein
VTQIAILYPVFLQVFLTLAVLALLAVARARAIRTMDRQRGNPDLAMGRTQWPDDATKRAANFRNQFELPVLFYVLTILSIMTRHADIVFVVLAWVFVLSRFGHAYIHTTSNNVIQRGRVYGVGVLALIIAWVVFIVRILLGLP